MEEKVFIKNNRGLKLAAVVHRPEGKGKFPAVILLHGFLGDKDLASFESMARQLCANNIVAIRFDASGFNESEGTVENDYRLTNYKADLGSVYKYLKLQSFVDSRRVGLCGQSMGGLLAVVFASQHPEIKAIGVISSPVKMNVLKIPKIKGEKFFDRESFKFGTVKIPYEFVDDAEQYDAVKSVPKVKGKLLFVWGTDDKVVPWQETKKIFEAGHEPKEFFEVASMGHKYYREGPPEIMGIVDEKVVEFFKKSL